MINGKTVALCMVVYNEAEQVEKLVESMKRVESKILNTSGNGIEFPEKIVDEVVIIDQGSSDDQSKRLQAIATIYHKTSNKGNADYDRQFCYSLPNSDYILAMDGDEIITKENILKLIDLVKKYDPDLIWFLFHNKMRGQFPLIAKDVTIDLKDILADDPHPRFWRKIVTYEGRVVPTVIWGNEAHTFPQIGSQKQIYSNLFFEHERDLVGTIRRHLHRGKNISDEAKQMEKRFIGAVISKFDKDVQEHVQSQVPELKEYLR